MRASGWDSGIYRRSTLVTFEGAFAPNHSSWIMRLSASISLVLDRLTCLCAPIDPLVSPSQTFFSYPFEERLTQDRSVRNFALNFFVAFSVLSFHNKKGILFSFWVCLLQSYIGSRVNKTRLRFILLYEPFECWRVRGCHEGLQQSPLHLVGCEAFERFLREGEETVILNWGPVSTVTVVGRLFPRWPSRLALKNCEHCNSYVNGNDKWFSAKA